MTDGGFELSEYVIISGTSIVHLCKEVSDVVKLGYMAVGGIIIDDKDGLYLQAMQKIEFIEYIPHNIAKSIINPSDVIILNHQKILGDKPYIRLKETFRKNTGLDNKLIILEEGLTISILTKNELEKKLNE